MKSTLWTLTHGSSGLVFGYLCVVVPMLVGLIKRNAPTSKLLVAPLVGIPAVLVAVIAAAMGSILLRGLGAAHDSALHTVFGLAAFVGTGWAAAYLLARSSTSEPSHRRGSVIKFEDSMPPVQQKTRGVTDSNTPISLAGIRVPLEDETKHFKIIGTTGTGKSTAIREILGAALARGDRAVIADPDGGYLDTFYDAGRGDIILNPFSPEAVKWNLLEEIGTDYDVDQLARSLIPDNGGDDRTWSEHARAFFIAVTQQALDSGRIKDDAALYHLLTKAPVKELKLLLANTSAGPLLEDGNERMFGSVRATASSAVRALNYTTRQQAPPFSVRKWVKQGAANYGNRKGGVLFIPYKAAEIPALRSIISAWMRLAIFEAMNLGEGDQRLWFVVDELDALGAIDGLKDALARLRKFGGRTVIGFQSIGQVSGTYGGAAADTIVENCGNTLILRCSASERGGTSEFASKLIGQREVMHTTRSTSRRTGEWLGSTTMSEHLKIEPAVMASEIERLPDLEGFLKFASVPDWRYVSLSSVNVADRGRAPSHAYTSRPAGSATPTDNPGMSKTPAGAPALEKNKAVRRRGVSRRQNNVAPEVYPPSGGAGIPPGDSQ